VTPFKRGKTDEDLHPRATGTDSTARVTKLSAELHNRRLTVLTDSILRSDGSDSTHGKGAEMRAEEVAITVFLICLSILTAAPYASAKATDYLTIHTTGRSFPDTYNCYFDWTEAGNYDAISLPNPLNDWGIGHEPDYVNDSSATTYSKATADAGTDPFMYLNVSLPSARYPDVYRLRILLENDSVKSWRWLRNYWNNGDSIFEICGNGIGCTNSASYQLNCSLPATGYDCAFLIESEYTTAGNGDYHSGISPMQSDDYDDDGSSTDTFYPAFSCSKYNSTCAYIYDIEVYFGYLKSDLDACNCTCGGTTRCAGPDMRYVQTCRNLTFGLTGEFDWDTSNMTYCPGGCLNGACQETGKICYNQCVTGERACSGNNIIHCTTDSHGCTVWSEENQDYCEHGCFNGQCITNLSTCEYGEQMCKSNKRMNCTLSSSGFWRFSILEECEFNCEYNTTESITQCTQVTDAHRTANSLTALGEYIGLMFENTMPIFYILASLVVTAIAMNFAGGSAGGTVPFLFIGLIVAGVAIQAIPLYIGATITVLGLAAIGAMKYNGK
jgi:hypothetical protein